MIHDRRAKWFSAATAAFLVSAALTGCVRNPGDTQGNLNKYSGPVKVKTLEQTRLEEKNAESIVPITRIHNTAYVPLDAVAKAIGFRSEWLDDGRFGVGDTDPAWTFRAGDSAVDTGEKSIRMPAPAVKQNGRLYVPASALHGLFGDAAAFRADAQRVSFLPTIKGYHSGADDIARPFQDGKPEASGGLKAESLGPMPGGGAWSGGGFGGWPLGQEGNGQAGNGQGFNDQGMNGQQMNGPGLNGTGSTGTGSTGTGSSGPGMNGQGPNDSTGNGQSQTSGIQGSQTQSGYTQNGIHSAIGDDGTGNGGQADNGQTQTPTGGTQNGQSTSDGTQNGQSTSNGAQNGQSTADNGSQGDNGQQQSSSSVGDHSDVIQEAEKYLGVKYDFGAGKYADTHRFDCSSFTQYIFGKFGVSLPRTAREQAQVGQSVSKDNLQKGDLVFFSVPGRFKSDSTVGHVGIYMGGGKMINANSAPEDGVQITDINKAYWQENFLSAKRIL